jgi:Flp pilus assembly protein TadG
MSHWKQNREKGIALIIGTCALCFIIPLIGLFVDLGILYSVKARLQAAVDGAALAAARTLNDGSTTAEQKDNAEQNATNWFYANFPTGNWATTGTAIATNNVQDDPNNPHLQDVTIVATTTVPTWFMRFLNFTSTNLSATGTASRRDVVAMLVLDRSGSMCSQNGVLKTQPCTKSNTTYACASMITAAKNFTGQFAAGRDRIGLASFSDGTYIDYAPATDFQTKLGYSNESGSGNGFIDSISCGGGTGTAEAMSLAYNELYKMDLPGALNVIMLETDGLPNTLVYNWWDGSNAGIASGSGCKDASGKTKSSGGWTTSASMRQWTSGHTMGPGGYMSDIPAGSIGAFYTTDSASGFVVLFDPTQTSSNKTGSSANSVYVTSNAPGCQFSGGTTGTISDFAWLPGSDVYGNSVNPSSAYQTVSMSGGHVSLSGNQTTQWTNAHSAALNATDNSAYNIRTNATLPAYVFVIGLGGNAGTPPDPVLLQRMANDPNGDQFNNPATYSACASETGCVTYSNQPQGTFIYSPDASNLGQAFLRIASQVLRLSH